MKRALLSLILILAAAVAGAEPVEAPAGAFDLAPSLSVREVKAPPEARALLVAAPGPASGVAASLAPLLADERRELERLLGGIDTGSVEIRIGYGREEFAGLQPRGARAPGWAAGVAYPDHGLVVIDAQASGRGGDVRGVLKHELAHVALGRLVHGRVPHWFTEGFAILYAGEWSLSRSTTLARATAAGALIPVDDLVGGWPGSPTDVDLAYAQSASLVSYLSGAGDGRVLQRLVHSLGEGVPFDDALRSAYGQPLVIVEIDWKKTLRGRYGWLPFFLDQELLWGIGGLLLATAAWRARARSKRRLAEMAEAEAREESRAAGEIVALFRSAEAELVQLRFPGEPAFPSPTPQADVVSEMQIPEKPHGIHGSPGEN